MFMEFCFYASFLVLVCSINFNEAEGSSFASRSIEFERDIYIKKGENLTATWKVILPKDQFYNIRISYNELLILYGNSTTYELTEKAINIFGDLLYVDVRDRVYTIGVDYKTLPQNYRSFVTEDIFLVELRTSVGGKSEKFITDITYDCAVNHDVTLTNVKCTSEDLESIREFPKVLVAVVFSIFLVVIFTFGAWVLRHQKNHFRNKSVRSTKKASSERASSLTIVSEMIPKAKKEIVEKTLKESCVMNFTQLFMAAVLSPDQVKEFCQDGKLKVVSADIIANKNSDENLDNHKEEEIPSSTDHKITIKENRFTDEITNELRSHGVELSIPTNSSSSNHLNKEGAPESS